MITKADRIRNYFKENPKATLDDASKALDFTRDAVRIAVWKDIDRGRAIKREDGYYYFSDEETFEITKSRPKTAKEVVVWEAIDIVRDHMNTTTDWLTIDRQLTTLRLFLGLLK